MSKFFGQDSSSSSESESENENEKLEVAPQKKVAQKIYESEEEEVRGRVVLSEKAKRSEEINTCVKQLKNAKKIRDVVKANEIFEDMSKAYEKCKKLIEKEGHFKQYIRAIAELEVFINELWADSEWRKAANKHNSTSLSKLRQRIKKYNKEFETEINDFKANPDSYPEEEHLEREVSESEKSADESSSEESSSEESDSNEEEEDKPKKKLRKIRGSDDDESSYWSEDEEESSSGDDIDMNADRPWEQFIKKTDGNQKSKKIHKKDTSKKKKHNRVAREDIDDDADKPTLEKVKLFTKDEEVNHVNVVTKLTHICSGRGRKGTDRKEQIELMTELRQISVQFNLGLPIELRIMLSQIAVNFDYNPRLNKCMKTENWNNCLKMLEEIVDVLMKNENMEINDHISEEQENLSDKATQFKIKGDLLTINDRLVHEYVKILQQCDAHGSEYVERLKDEPKICALIDRLITYEEGKGEKQDLCRIYLKKVEHLYYKYDSNNESKTCELMEKLCKYIYTNDSTDRLRTKAMLCHIYHHALHDRWFDARDLMLMSHLQESIDNSDIPLQILYNRTMVQLGLCAFRVGNIKESHAALLDIQIGNRAKELLAQGMMVQRNVEKSKEQEMKERQRLIPFHMHINLELIECLYLISAMLIEIPYISSRDYETKKRLISKQFHYQLKFSERQPVVGPPENMREHVVAASKAMRNGEWKACINFLVNEKMNAKVWNLMSQSTETKTMLTEKVKEESLRTYLFRYSSIYESISIENLAQMFELPRPQVYSIISKMIINEELMASLDEPTQTVVMHRTEPTKIQTLALQLSEKITTLMDQTERMIQVKGGDMTTFMGDRRQQGQQGGQQRDGQQQNNYHRGDNRGQSNYNKGGGYRGNKEGGGYHGNKSEYHGNKGEYHGNRNENRHNQQQKSSY